MVRPRSDIQQRLVESARAHFLARGVDGASLRSIASDAGTNIGMVYYYFPAKDDLFLAVVEQAYVPLLERLSVTLTDERPLAERIERLYAFMAGLSPPELESIRLILREALGSGSRLEGLLARFARGHLRLLLHLIEGGQRDGLLRRDLPPLVALVALGALGALPLLGLRLLPAHIAALAPAGDATRGLPRRLAELYLRAMGADAVTPAPK